MQVFRHFRENSCTKMAEKALGIIVALVDSVNALFKGSFLI
jgi:hypothetical protein